MGLYTTNHFICMCSPPYNTLKIVKGHPFKKGSCQLLSTLLRLESKGRDLSCVEKFVCCLFPPERILGVNKNILTGMI